MVAEHVITQEQVLCVLYRRGCVSLRALCSELWPALRWRPLYHDDDSIAEGGNPPILEVWSLLGLLLTAGTLRIAGRDPDEVDDLASVAIEVVGPPEPNPGSPRENQRTTHPEP